MVDENTEKKESGEKRECAYCKKEIDLKQDRYTLLADYRGEKEMDKNFYHFKCFVEWFNSKVTEKAKNSVQGMQNKAVNLFGNLKENGFINNLIGKKSSSLLGNFLGKDLEKKKDKKKETSMDQILNQIMETQGNSEDSEDSEQSKSETKKEENGKSGKSEKSKE